MENSIARILIIYLLQHACNPVDWFPWCDEAFVKAKADAKPVFLSSDQVKLEIFKLKQQCQDMQQQTKEERLDDLLNFSTNIPTMVDNSQRNELYKTIIDSIIYLRDGDNVKVNIIFK